MRKVALGFLKLQWTQAMLTVVLKCHEIFYLYFLAQKTLYLAKMAQRTFQFGKDNSIFKFENHVSRGNGNLFLQQVIPHFYIFTLLLLGGRAPPVKISQPLPPLPRQPKFCILNESESKTPGLDGGLRGSKNIRKKTTETHNFRKWRCGGSLDMWCLI